MTTLLDLLDIPKGAFTLLIGPPGSGKSTFVCKSQLYQLLDRNGACLSIVTEQTPASMRQYMSKLDTRFADRNTQQQLRFVDGYRKTVGLKGGEGPEANSADLTSMTLAVADCLRDFNQPDTLLVLDSLTPVYFLCGDPTIRFAQTVLARYATEGLRVIATIDEGVAKTEHLTTIMSLAGVILKIRRDIDRSFIDVLKHPAVKTPTVEFPLTEQVFPMRCRLDLAQNHKVYRSKHTDELKATARAEMPDYVHILWLQLAFWGGMLWDPKRFPRLVYEIVRDLETHCMKLSMTLKPWHERLLFSLWLKSVNVTDPKSASRVLEFGYKEALKKKVLVGEFLKEKSRFEELHVKVNEYAVSWAFPNIGRSICIPMAAGVVAALSLIDRSHSDWSCYEAQCVASGAEHCELVVVKGHRPEFEQYVSGLQYSEIEPVVGLLMQRCVSLATDGRDRMTRPTLGSDVHLSLFQDLTSVPALSNERYMTAIRLSGVYSGRALATQFLNRGLDKKQTQQYLLNFLQQVKAGIPTLGDTIRIKDCAEAAGILVNEHVCSYTTGFLNGFLETALEKRVTEVRCIAAGDNVCEWTY